MVVTAILQNHSAIAEAPIPAIWIKPPTGKEICPWTSLSRQGFYKALALGGASIKTLALRAPGQARGPRLVWLPDLHAALVAMARAQAGEGELPQ
jgi:hypothetical protein